MLRSLNAMTAVLIAEVVVRKPFLGLIGVGLATGVTRSRFRIGTLPEHLRRIERLRLLLEYGDSLIFLLNS